MSGFDIESAGPVIEREDEGQVLHVRDVTGELMYFGDSEPVTMTVVGTYSTRYRRAMDAQSDKRMLRGAGRRPDELNALKRDALNVVADCVTAWRGFFDGGHEIDCTPANVARVLEVAPWIREQVERAMDDHAAFFASASRA